jgi:hypothetical protein
MMVSLENHSSAGKRIEKRLVKQCGKGILSMVEAIKGE